MPRITGVIRRNGTTAVISWDPISYTSAKGHLTEIDLIYGLSTRGDCSDLDITKSPDITLTVDDDLYNISSRSIDSLLQANNEYCVAIRASTAVGPSAYSRPDKVICKRTCFIAVQVASFLCNEC